MQLEAEFMFIFVVYIYFCLFGLTDSNIKLLFEFVVQFGFQVYISLHEFSVYYKLKVIIFVTFKIESH